MFRASLVALVMWGVGVPLIFAEEVALPVTPPPYEEGRLVEIPPPVRKHQHKKQADAVLNVFRVNNTKATLLADVIYHLLREIGGNNPLPQGWGEVKPIIIADSSTNSLLVNATPAMQKKIKALIEQLDVRPPMVQVELIVVETSKDRRPTTTKSDKGSKSASKEFSKALLISAEQLKKDLGLACAGSSADSRGVALKIDALEKAGRLRVVRRPQISALSSQAAQLTIGRKEPHVTGVSMSKFGEQSSINYRELGLVLTVTARASSDDVVTMEISLTESHVGPAHEGVPISKSKQRTIWAPRIKSISAQSVVCLKSGKATVLGGLAASESTEEPEQLVIITATVVRE